MKEDNDKASNNIAFLITIMVFPWLITLGCVRGGWTWGPAITLTLLAAWIIVGGFIAAYINSALDRFDEIQKARRGGEDG